MKPVRITAIRKAEYRDLMDLFENPMENACSVTEGQTWISEDWQKPEGFCESAWQTISPFVLTLACGGKGIYGDWMKNPNSALISCNDGFRPVSFLLEAMDSQDLSSQTE